MGGRRREKKLWRVKLISLAVASCFAREAVYANPTGPTVVNGQVSFHQQGNLLQITNSPNSIINWQSFWIGAGEITRCVQPSASSAVLNRVVTQDPSSILGALQSNGRVLLINPNGILFGAGAQIDVAGLVASTLKLSDADFLAGRLRFTEQPGAGSVVNQGAINTPQGGQVYLVGPAVTNGGIITSPRGEVILAAGNTVELVDPGTPSLRVEITAPDNQAINLGQIVADVASLLGRQLMPLQEHLKGRPLLVHALHHICDPQLPRPLRHNRRASSRDDGGLPACLSPELCRTLTQRTSPTGERGRVWIGFISLSIGFADHGEN